MQYSQENTCVGVSFSIKLQTWRPATLLKRDSSTGVFLWIFRIFQEHLFWKISTSGYFCKITYFEEHLRTPASIKCYFNRKTYFLKILVSKRKYENNIENCQSHKKKKKFTIPMFYYQIPWFYQDFKSENPCF